MSDTFQVHLERLDGYRFRVEFDGGEVAPLVVDEPPPLGAGSGPNPSRLLAAAVGNCLCASLYFCLQKSRVEVSGLRASVTGEYRRNERKRLRIGGLSVSIVIDAPDESAEKLARCLPLFEDFCVVTASVRAGLDVQVRISDRDGRELYRSGGEGSD